MKIDINNVKYPFVVKMHHLLNILSTSIIKTYSRLQIQIFNKIRFKLPCFFSYTSPYIITFFYFLTRKVINSAISIPINFVLHIFIILLLLMLKSIFFTNLIRNDKVYSLVKLKNIINFNNVSTHINIMFIILDCFFVCLKDSITIENGMYELFMGIFFINAFFLILSILLNSFILKGFTIFLTTLQGVFILLPLVNVFLSSFQEIYLTELRYNLWLALYYSFIFNSKTNYFFLIFESFICTFCILWIYYITPKYQRNKFKLSMKVTNTLVVLSTALAFLILPSIIKNNNFFERLDIEEIYEKNELDNLISTNDNVTNTFLPYIISYLIVGTMLGQDKKFKYIKYSDFGNNNVYYLFEIRSILMNSSTPDEIKNLLSNAKSPIILSD